MKKAHSLTYTIDMLRRYLVPLYVKNNFFLTFIAFFLILLFRCVIFSMLAYPWNFFVIFANDCHCHRRRHHHHYYSVIVFRWMLSSYYYYYHGLCNCSVQRRYRCCDCVSVFSIIGFRIVFFSVSLFLAKKNSNENKSKKMPKTFFCVCCSFLSVLFCFHACLL